MYTGKPPFLIPGTKSQTLFKVRDLVPCIKNEVFHMYSYYRKDYFSEKGIRYLFYSKLYFKSITENHLQLSGREKKTIAKIRRKTFEKLT